MARAGSTVACKDQEELNVYCAKRYEDTHAHRHPAYAPMDLFGLPKWICSGALEPSEHAGSDCFGTYAAIGTCVAILIDIEQSTLDACGAHK